jgi:hypothetical protein
MIQFLICGDINVGYLINCDHKQQLSSLLGTYNMFYTVNFPTRFQNNHNLALDNIFIDKSRLHTYVVLPWSNALYDHDAQCLILNNFFYKGRCYK